MKTIVLVSVIAVSLLLLLPAAGCVDRNNSGHGDVSTNDARSSAPKAKPVRVSVEGSDSAEPAIAAVPDGGEGKFYVAWVQHGGGAAQGGDLYVRAYSAGEAGFQPLGEAVRVNPPANRVKSWRGDPPTIVATADNSVYVGWNSATSDTATGAKGNDLMLSVSHNGGRTFDPPVKINDDSIPASHGMHALALGSGGRVFAAWLDERYLAEAAASRAEPRQHAEMRMTDEAAAEPNAELYFAASTDGGRSFGANRRVARDVCPCCKVSLAAGGDGGPIFVSWRQVLPGEFRHIAVASSNDAGASFGAPVVVSDDKWKLTACPVSGPSLLLNDGALEIMWYAGGEAGPKGFYWSHTHDGGASFSPPSLVAASDAGGHAALLPGFAVWSAGGSVSSAALDDGRPLTASTDKITDGDNPQAVLLANHRPVVAFTRTENGGGAAVGRSAGSSVWLAPVR